MPKKSTSSVHNIGKDKPAFGSRFLTEKDDVWSQNAWDHVAPPSDQDEKITASLEKQRSNPVPPHEKQIYNDKPAKHWDNFYKANANHFFRNRKWLHNEFPELVAATKADAGPVVITELGCGAGNSIFPLLTSNKNPHLRLKAYDYSHHAIKLVQRDPLYLSTSNPESAPSLSSPSDSEPNPTVIGTITAAVWDLTSPSLPSDLEESSVDIVILVFVLSALSPDEWGRTVANIHKILKPNGLVILRDYGRYDLTQLRFKGGRLLDENFYIRGDKTRVYFFELDELALLFTGLKAPANSHTHAKASSRQSVGLEYVGDDEDDTRLSPVTITASDGNVEDVYIHPDSGVSEVSVCSCDSDSTPAPSLATPPPGEDRLNDPTPVGSGVPPLSIISTANELELPTALASATSHIHPSLVPPPFSPPHQAQALSQEATLFTHLPNCPPHPLFTAEQLGVDRRLIVNRKRRVKMYRVWMQGVFKKISRS